jgi:hypothetical protein
LQGIRRISLAIATRVASMAYARGIARRRKPKNVRRDVASFMYEP